MKPARLIDDPWALVNEKFFKVEDAVVEVANNLETPRIGLSIPAANVEVAVEVATNAPAVQGLNELAKL